MSHSREWTRLHPRASPGDASTLGIPNCLSPFCDGEQCLPGPTVLIDLATLRLAYLADGTEIEVDL